MDRKELRQLKFCQTWTIWILLSILIHQFAGVDGEICEIYDSINRTAYVEWPFLLDCSYLEDIWRYEHNDTGIESGVNTSCSITGDTENFNDSKLMEFEKVENKVFNLSLVVDGNQCLTSQMTITIMPFPNATCREFLDESKQNGDIIHVEAINFEANFRLYCCPPSSLADVSSCAKTGEGFSTIWLRYCDLGRDETYRPFTTIRNEKNGTECPDNFYVGNMEFFDAGEFVCSVSYKEKTLYVSSRSVCVKREVTDTPPSVICATDERKPAGETGVIACDATVPIGPTLQGELGVEWLKGDTSICSNSNINALHQSDKHSCSAMGPNDPLKCVYSYDEREPYTKTLSLRLNIRDLKKDDFGSYTVKVTYRNKEAQYDSTLTEDLAPYYARLAVILGLLFIVIAAIVGVIIYYKRNTLEAKLRLIKLLGYQKKGRKVYLSYHYDIAMSESEQETMNLIVQTILEGTECYDINRDGTPGIAVAEYVPGVISSCHTTLLVITERFVECAERQFDAEQALGQLLSSRKRMLFVVTPGGYRALNRPNLDEIWSKITVAIKIAEVFSWRNGSPTEVQKLKRFLSKRIPTEPAGIRYLARPDEITQFDNIFHEDI